MNLKIKLLNKICAILILTSLLVSDFLFVGTKLISYAIDNGKTNIFNVDFVTYFLDENGEKQKKIQKSIDEDNIYLYVDLNVKNEGYFNGNIELENCNFELKEEIESKNISKVSGDKITLQQINAGEQVTLKLPIKPKTSNIIKAEDLNKKSKVNLIGKYVNSKNVENINSANVNGSSEVEINWKSSNNSEVELDAKILTNSSYMIENEEKQIVQMLISSKITNNNYPIKNTQINLDVLQNVEDVKVHTRSTDATNSNIKFSDTNYIYDKETNNLKIDLKNENKDMVSWEKDALDVVVVTFILNKDENILNKEIKVNSKINTYDEKELVKSKGVILNNKKDGIISYSLKNSNDSIYKGNLYIGVGKEYKETQKIDIDFLGIANKLSLKSNKDVYVNNANEVSAKILYKQTKINKENFINLFGEEGFITVKDEKGTTIANLNNKTNADEQGNFVIDYSKNTKNIEIITSKPINLGSLNIENTKIILNDEYNREDVNNFTSIKNYFIGSYNEKQIETIEEEIELKNTISKAKIALNTEKLTAEKTNKNVKIKVVLQNNSEKLDVFSNPEIKITFPKQVTNLTAKCKVLYGNGLELGDSNIQNEDGRNVINIKLNGEQAEYNPTNIDGTTIAIYANIDIDKNATTSIEDIMLDYTNQFAKTLENDGKEKTKVKILEVKKEEKQSDSEINKEQPKVYMQEVKNLNGIKINSTANVGEEKLQEGAQVKAGEIIFYNIELENTTDVDVQGLSLTANIPENTTLVEVNPKFPGYDEELEMYTNEEEYLIEKQEREIKKENIQIKSKEKINISYCIRVDANLTNNKECNIENVIKHNDDTMSLKNRFNIVPSVITAVLKPQNRRPNDELNYSYSYKYTLTIQNNSDVEQNNIQLKINNNELLKISKIQISLKEKYEQLTEVSSTITIDKLPANEVAYVIIDCIVLEYTANIINAEMSVNINSNENTFRSNKISEVVTGPKAEMTVTTETTNNKEVLSSENTIKYIFKIKNTGKMETEKFNIIDTFSNYLKLDTVTINNEQYQYIHTVDEDENKINIEKSINIGEEITLEIVGTVIDEIEDGKEYECLNQCSVYYDGIILAKTENIKYTIKNEIEEDNQEEKEEKDKDLEDDEIDQKESDENNEGKENETSDGKDENKDAEDEQPNSEDTDNTSQNDENNQEDGKQEDENQEEENGNSEDENQEDEDGNSEDENQEDEDGNSDKENLDKDSEDYNDSESSISGIAWVDKNKDGKRDSEESILTGMAVVLLNLENNKMEETQTDDNGVYEFENVENGKYIVIFEYDDEIYSLTTYQAEGVSSSQNSDAEIAEISIDGEKQKVASTDTLTVNNLKLSNIDIGLIESSIFDLALTKTISKISTSNAKGTSTQEFLDSNLAKIEINAKYIKGTTVVIEYLIKVTNKGEIPGYATQIVDYKPTDLTFSSKLNPTWYQEENKLYNDSLDDELINPGETKELKLILTKQMTETNTGLTSNIAEIVKDENENEVNDTNSTPGNKNDGENDQGQANVIISIGTGAAIRFVLITLLFITFSATLGYIISKKILEKKISI